MRKKWAALILPIFLVSCMPVGVYKGAPAHDPVPPATFSDWEKESPDVVLFVMSGACFSECSDAWGVYDALGKQGTVDLLAQALSAGGNKVRSFSYVSSPLDAHYSHDHKMWGRGWQALQRDYTLSKKHWPKARVVLLGFSHGMPWMDSLVRMHPNDTFDVTIDLEGICHTWNKRYLKTLQSLPPEQNGGTIALEACKPLPWPNWPHSRFNEVPDNVTLNLEMSSTPAIYSKQKPSNNRVNYFWDATPNFRKDGSKHGIESVSSLADSHRAIDDPESPSMTWLAARLAELSREWAKEKNETLKN